MNKTFLNVVLIILAMIGGKLFSQHFITATQYKTFTSDLGGYSVLIPTDTESKVETINILSGSITGDAQSAIDYNLGIKFSVHHFKMPAFLMSSANPDKVLKTMSDDFISWANGTILSDQKTEFRSFPGRECSVKKSDGKTVKMKVFMVRDKIYQMIVYCKSADSGNKRIGQFFDSFNLTKI